MPIRKTITIFVLCLAALLPLCLSGFFIAGRILIRIAMLEKMEKEQLQTVRIPTKHIRWYKKNRELDIDGKMFDVKSIRQIGDTSIVTGLFDEDDTVLHETLTGIHEQKNKGNINALMLYQVCLGIIAEQNLLRNQSFSPNSKLVNSTFAHFKVNFLEIFLPCFSPPPEIKKSSLT
jgi:hypothetical protein